MIGAADVFVGFVVVYVTYLLCKHESVCVRSGLCARLCVPRCIAVILLRTSVCICLLLWVDVCTCSCVCIRDGGVAVHYVYDVYAYAYGMLTVMGGVLGNWSSL